MSISLTPTSPRTLAVGVSDDPYKKYWWVILLGCAATGAWLCAPMMETSVGSTRVDPNKPAVDASGEQGLASAASGGAGHAYDLSMGVSGAKKKDGLDAPESMLMPELQDETAASGAAASGAPIGSATGGSSGSLASALKSIGQKNDAAGWSGEKAQRGFAAPHLGGGSMSGLGGISGGRGGSASVGAFGTRNAQVAGTAGVGLVDDGSDRAAAAGRAAMGALGQMSAQANKAALLRSNDGAASQMNRLFDGAKGQNQISTGGGAGGASGGAYAALDQAPINLKVNPDGEDSKKITNPPATPAPPAASGQSGTQMAEMVGGMLISAVAGGMIGGMAGQMVAMAGMMAMQTMVQQQQASATANQAAAQQKINGGPH